MAAMTNSDCWDRAKTPRAAKARVATLAAMASDSAQGCRVRCRNRRFAIGRWIQRIAANTLKATAKKGGKVVGEYTFVVSADGRTTTVNDTDTDSEGNPYKGSISGYCNTVPQFQGLTPADVSETAAAQEPTNTATPIPTPISTFRSVCPRTSSIFLICANGIVSRRRSSPSRIVTVMASGSTSSRMALERLPSASSILTTRWTPIFLARDAISG